MKTLQEIYLNLHNINEKIYELFLKLSYIKSWPGCGSTKNYCGFIAYSYIHTWESGFQESGILGKWDFGKVSFHKNGILGMRDFEKMGFGKVGFLESGILGKWDFEKVGF